MTNEEVERAIETLLNNQATFETQLEKTNRQIEQTNRQIEQTNHRLEIHAESQTEFIQIVLKQIEAQGEVNASLRNTVRDLASTVERLAQGSNGTGGVQP